MLYDLLISILIISIVVSSVHSSNSHHIISCDYTVNKSTSQTRLTLNCGEHLRDSEFNGSTKSSVYKICEKKLRCYGDCRTDSEPLMIQAINFENCHLPEMPIEIFEMLKNVDVFDMTNLGIESLHSNSFIEAKNLITLIASQNQITHIPANILSKNIIDADFSFNQIQNISNFAFDMDSIVKLNLSHNQISKFQSKIFKRHSNLQQLDVSWNKISILTSSTFRGLRRLMHLDLSGNSIQCVSRKSFLTLLSLQHLNLSQNSLSKIELGAFSTIIELQTLDLSNNKLKTLDVNIFSIPSQLQVLSIANNQLQNFDRFIIARISMTKIVGIDSNQVSCSNLQALLEEFGPEQFDSMDSMTNQSKCSSIVVNTEPSDYIEDYIFPSTDQTIDYVETDEELELDPLNLSKNMNSVRISSSFYENSIETGHYSQSTVNNEQLVWSKPGDIFAVLLILTVMFSSIVMMITWFIIQRIGKNQKTSCFLYKKTKSEDIDECEKCLNDSCQPNGTEI